MTVKPVSSTTFDPVPTNAGDDFLPGSDGRFGVEGSKYGPGLYVVATPIGNLGDITIRALDVLAAASLIVCEDTRHTGKLLAHYRIKAATQSYNDHNAPKVRPGLLKRLQDGEIVALVSDAGTPLISDPGYRLVTEAVEAGVSITAVPGASAVTTALSVAGVPTDRFMFMGFLPSREGEKAAMIDTVKHVPASLVFFESPRRLADSLAALQAGLGDRPAVVLRELTKLHETVERAPLSRLTALHAGRPAPKGEIVIIVEGASGREAGFSDEEVDQLIRDALLSDRPSEAARMVASQTGLPRKTVYSRLLALKNGHD